MQANISISGVRAAHQQIKPLIRRTPIMMSEVLSNMASTPNLKTKFYFKCENLQKSGSFKFRGASNFLVQQADADLRKGVVAISTGNFGGAVALAAKTAGQRRSLPIDVSVVLPESSSPSKIAGVEQNGANVVLAGADPQDRERVAKRILQETGATLAGPLDDPRIVLGQATATMEMVDQIEEMDGEKLDAVVLPSGTGGILSGAAIVCKDTGTAVFGCEPQKGGPDLHRSLATGALVTPGVQNSVADGLRALTAKGNFETISQRHLVDGVFTATDGEIKDAWRLLVEELKMLIEPSSAVTLAVILFNKEFRSVLARRKAQWSIGIILTGGNTTVSKTAEEFSNMGKA